MHRKGKQYLTTPVARRVSKCFLLLSSIVISYFFIFPRGARNLDATKSNLSLYNSFGTVDEKEFPDLFLLSHLLLREGCILDFNRLKQFLWLTVKNRNSILIHYLTSQTACRSKLYIPDYRLAVRKFVLLQGNEETRRPRSNKNTLTVIIEKGIVADDVLGPFSSVLEGFSKVIFVKSNRTGSESSQDLLSKMRLVTTNIGLIQELIIASPEEIIMLSSEAHNLFVYSGDMSAMAALACNGTILYTKSFNEYMLNLEFRNSLVKVKALFRKGIKHPAAQIQALEIFQPQPSCCSFKYMGRRLEQKIICTNALEYAVEPCWVLSIGSKGQFQFERAITENTNCHVQVFDCTGTWTVPPDLSERVTMHKFCVGFYNDTRDNYFPLRHLIEIGGNELKSSSLPTLLKLDADGYEFTTLSELVIYDKRFMPGQIALEIHMRYNQGVLPPYKPIVLSDGSPSAGITEVEAKQFVATMSSAGYKLVNRIDDVSCPAVCSEVLFVKADALP